MHTIRAMGWLGVFALVALPGCIYHLCGPLGALTRWDQPGLYNRLPESNEGHPSYEVTHDQPEGFNRASKFVTFKDGLTEYTLHAANYKDEVWFWVQSPGELRDDVIMARLNQFFRDFNLGSPTLKEWDSNWSRTC